MLKALEPTAQVKVFKKAGGDSGFDDMEDDLHVLEGEPAPKLFNAPPRK
jgi:hypothetical protein